MEMSSCRNGLDGINFFFGDGWGWNGNWMGTGGGWKWVGMDVIFVPMQVSAA